jgi:predicted nucleic acid-binding protein
MLDAARLRLVQLAISDALLVFVQRVEPSLPLDVITRDPSDNRVLECAVAAGSRFIVTGDDDLLSLGTYEGIRSMKVAAFLEFAQLPVLWSAGSGSGSWSASRRIAVRRGAARSGP